MLQIVPVTEGKQGLMKKIYPPEPSHLLPQEHSPQEKSVNVQSDNTTLGETPEMICPV